jgi:succinate-acetate transporter protein
MEPITTSDLLGLGLFGGFGLWWLAFPKSVIRFYTWFHSRKVRIPSPRVIRILGAAWMAFVFAVVLFSRK